MKRIAILMPALALPLVVFCREPEFVLIPAGSFVMGCDSTEPCSKSLPRRKVEFARSFWMAKTEVSVQEFRAFSRATGYRTEAEKAGDKRTWISPMFHVEDHQAVVYLSLNDAAAYCEWIGARVPLEAEWEYAARAGTTTYHYWGGRDRRPVSLVFREQRWQAGTCGQEASERVGLIRRRGKCF